LCGNINYANGKFWATEHAVVCYPKKDFVTKWLGELLRAMNLNQYSESAAQPGLSVERIKQLVIPVPPISEQQEIADYLDNMTSKIDATIQELKTQIEDLRQYKKSVISEAVTGKVDLRDWKPK
jgi:type I restriction enzyme S subunit